MMRRPIPAPARRSARQGLWRGTIAAGSNTVRGWFVTIERHAGSYATFGPCDVVESPWAPMLTQVVELLDGDGADISHGHNLGVDDDGHPAHPLAVLQLTVGDRVLCGFLEGRPNDLVILGRIR